MKCLCCSVHKHLIAAAVLNQAAEDCVSLNAILSAAVMFGGCSLAAATVAAAVTTTTAAAAAAQGVFMVGHVCCCCCCCCCCRGATALLLVCLPGRRNPFVRTTVVQCSACVCLHDAPGTRAKCGWLTRDSRVDVKGSCHTLSSTPAHQHTRRKHASYMSSIHQTGSKTGTPR